MLITKRAVLFLIIFSSQPVLAAKIRKPGLEFFDHVYTINLKTSTDRREHVINEFTSLGIKNYEILEATDKDSVAVKELMQSSFVKKYPPCFRCGKIFCNCLNNVLIKQQIGNWHSFIRVFKDIITKNYEFVLITEDDVKFTVDAKLIFSELINPRNFSKYNIDSNKPILIRLEGRQEITENNRGLNNIKFTKDITMSNACFMVNKLYAITFLKNLKIIDVTSDVYLQDRILGMDKSIQHFTAYPAPSYQLSDNKNAIFYSEIHPKGIDANDKLRAKQHKKRIEYWEYLAKKIAFWSKE